MRPNNKITAITIFIPLFLTAVLHAQEPGPTQAEITSDNINLRSDSTVTSKIICSLNKGDAVEIVSKSYDWYKIRLPKGAPSFINKKFVTFIDDTTAKVNANNVNIRLGPSDSSPILGKAQENEVVSIIKGSGSWYKIEPVNNSFAWVNSRFVNTQKKKEAPPKEDKLTSEKKDGEFNVEGIIKPKVITRIATHKLVTSQGEIFLLQGNKESLNALNNHKAKVCGKLNYLPEQEHPLITITKMEALD